MTIKDILHSRPVSDGTTLVRCVIQSDEMPEPMPTTGEGIDGLFDAARIDVGSELHVLADGGHDFVMGEDGSWYEIEKGGTTDKYRLFEKEFPSDSDFYESYNAASKSAEEVYEDLRSDSWPILPSADDTYFISALLVVPPGSAGYFNIHTKTSGTNEDRGQNSYVAHIENGHTFVVDSVVPYVYSTSQPYLQDCDISVDYADAVEFDEAGNGIFLVLSDNIPNVKECSILSDVCADLDIYAPEVFVRSVKVSRNYFLSITAYAFGEYLYSGDVGPFANYREYVTVIRKLNVNSVNNKSNKGAFEDCTGLVSICDIDIRKFRAPTRLFKDCSGLIRAPRLFGLDEYDGDISHMFDGCISMLAVSDKRDLVVNAKSVSYMLPGCVSLRLLPHIVLTSAEQVDVEDLFGYSGNDNISNPAQYAWISAENGVKNANGVFYGMPALVKARIDSDILAVKGYLVSSGYEEKELLLSRHVKIEQPSTKQYNFYGAFRGSPISDVTDMDVSGVTNAENLYASMKALSVVPDPVVLPEAGVISGLFSGCVALYGDISVDAQKATKAEEMISGCKLIRSVTLNAPLVTNLSSFAKSAKSIESISLYVSGEQYMTSAFSGCRSLLKLDLKNPLTAKGDISYMFNSCGLKELPDGLSFSGLTKMGGTFRSSSIRNIPSLDVTNVSYFYECFNGQAETIGKLVGFGAGMKSGTTSNIFPNTYTAEHRMPLKRLILDSTVTEFAGCPINVQYCSFDHDGLIELFESLPTITATKNITITGNPGADGLKASEIAIATDRNWNIIGATNIIDDVTPPEEGGEG